MSIEDPTEPTENTAQQAANEGTDASASTGKSVGADEEVVYLDYLTRLSFK